MGNKSSPYASSCPQNVKKRISIKLDPVTGKLLGVPKEWAEQLNTDENYIVETSSLPEEVRTEIQKSNYNLSR